MCHTTPQVDLTRLATGFYAVECRPLDPIVEMIALSEPWDALQAEADLASGVHMCVCLA